MSAGWSGAAEIQWACLLIEYLGEDSLLSLPLLMSGYRSIDSMPQLNGNEIPLQNLRKMDVLPRMMSRESVRAAMQNARRAEEKGELELAYTLHPATLTFQRKDTHSTLLTQQLHTLLQPKVDAPHGLKLAPTDTPLTVRFGQQDQVRVQVPAAEAPPAPFPHSPHSRTGTLVFTLKELEETAAGMDADDAVAKRPKRNWARTVAELKLRVRTEHSFEDGTALNLEGLHHLIGLPGAGKTTLITVLCVHMARRGQRIAVFTTAIEVARQQLEVLVRYLAPDDVALLVGRGHDTHERHADRIAGVVAADDPELNGFGRTVPGMDRFARGCSLRAYALGDEEGVWEHWGPEQAPPCEQVLRRVPRTTAVSRRSAACVHCFPAAAGSGTTRSWSKRRSGSGMCSAPPRAFPPT